MQASPTPIADHTGIYIALISLLGTLLLGLSSFVAYILSRPKQKAEVESIRVGTIASIMENMETMRMNRESSDEAHRKIVRELEAELDKSRDGEREQRDVAAAKWREINNCFLYMELLEDKLEVPLKARYKKRTREEIIKSVD